MSDIPPELCWCRPGSPESPVRSPHEKSERCTTMTTKRHCPRCRRELRSWPLHRPNRCAPPNWRYCIREVPGVVAPE